MTNTELIRQEIERRLEITSLNILSGRLEIAQKHIYLKEVYESLLSFIDSLPKEAPQGWISVKDRLPDNSEYVLTCSNTKGTPPFVRLHYYKDGKWLLNESAYPAPIEYWMPIPKFKEE